MSEEQIDLLNCPNCGATYLRAGECPALCSPPPMKPPKYKGPLVVGRTHMSRLAAPVYRPADWAKNEEGIIVDDVLYKPEDWIG